MNRTITTLDKKDLIAMRLLQSKDANRYALNGVHFHITPKIARLVATDGRRLGILRIEKDNSLPEDQKLVTFTVNYPLVKFMASDSIRVEFDGKNVTFHNKSASDGFVTYEAIDGTFPAWKQVVPKASFDKAEISFDYRLLDTFSKVSKALSPRQAAQITVKSHSQRPEGGQHPYSIFIPADLRFYGMLMPAMDRIEKVPDWATTED